MQGKALAAAAVGAALAAGAFALSPPGRYGSAATATRDGLAAALGSEARCAAYGGLPPGWGEDPHAGMARVQGGSFRFGSTAGYPDERPAAQAQVQVRAFWIDRTEVTVAQFAAFVAATGYVTEAEEQGGAVVFRTPTPEQLQARPYAWWSFVKGADWRHPGGPGSGIEKLDAVPVTFVTQRDALAYARWLGRDLPTEAEWEYAAKAGREGEALDRAPRDAQDRPTANYWQGNFPAVNLREDGHAGLAPVGCYAANPWGLHDMIGNAWEWTRDRYAGPHQAHLNGDTAAVAAAQAGKAVLPGARMVIKGGSFLCSPDFCVRYRASAREAAEADLGTAHIGFRTVRREAS
ncbi:SUMF1/EgtB/PvdO family nonheme iron enzyme [Azohydromonas australica]|uniref:SUMF1/EgtB/PvdO family nonheme iron enzyme n=1 Tax=Azohydromonas australica TaxID=364039 RepID=UPI0003FAE3AC|nr:SUMF1/EgtB/PvdO family nonheme iron enzyme [Azohydromonas australica]